MRERERERERENYRDRPGCGQFIKGWKETSWLAIRQRDQINLVVQAPGPYNEIDPVHNTVSRSAMSQL